MWKIGDLLPRGLSYYPRVADPTGIYVRTPFFDPVLEKRRYIGDVFYFHKFASPDLCFAAAQLQQAEIAAYTMPKGPTGRYYYSTNDGRSHFKGHVRKKNSANKSGIVGVKYYEIERESAYGVKSTYRAWAATWTVNGKSQAKWFSFASARSRLVTSDMAKAKAIAYREKMIAKYYKTTK